MEGIAFGVLERIVARRGNRQNSREDKNKLIRLTVAVALACGILLSSIPASAKWLLMVQFGTDSKLVWKWTPFDVYSNADECKHAILSYQLNASLGRYFSRPLMCLSDHDRRWGDQQPHWILRASSAPFNTFVAVFPDKDRCEIRGEESCGCGNLPGTECRPDAWRERGCTCISLDDPQFEPPPQTIEKIEWDLLVPPAFGASSGSSLKDWDIHATYNSKQTCQNALAADARLKRVGAVCVSSDDSRLKH